MKNYHVKMRISMIVLVSIMCIYLTGCASSEYKKAQDLMNNGNFEEANVMFSKIPDYKDASEQMVLCQYKIGISAFDAGEYEKALEILTKIEHLDSKDKVKESKYYLAKTAMESNEWEKAIELLNGLNFLDSKELLASATQEKGMAEKSDNAFLADMEISILTRMESADNPNRKQLCNVELAYLEKYLNAEFYDQNLKEIANKYINGIIIQKASLDCKSPYEQQIEWQRGTAERFTALSDLYYDYDFLKENATFVGTYVSEAETQASLIEAYDTVEADLASQMVNGDFEWELSGGYICCTLKNNTKYTFSTIFNFNFYDGNNTLFENRATEIDDIKPDALFKVSIYVGDFRIQTSNFSMEWENWYIDMKIN